MYAQGGGHTQKNQAWRMEVTDTFHSVDCNPSYAAFLPNCLRTQNHGGKHVIDEGFLEN